MIGSIPGVSSDTTKTDPTTSATSSIATKDMFLKLLVTQLKNQNPLNPEDGMQFVSQLAEFTNLEQVTDIRSAVDAIRSKVAPDTTTSSSKS